MAQRYDRYVPSDKHFSFQGHARGIDATMSSGSPRQTVPLKRTIEGHTPTRPQSARDRDFHKRYQHNQVATHSGHTFHDKKRSLSVTAPPANKRPCLDTQAAEQHLANSAAQFILTSREKDEEIERLRAQIQKKDQHIREYEEGIQAKIAETIEDRKKYFILKGQFDQINAQNDKKLADLNANEKKMQEAKEKILTSHQLACDRLRIIWDVQRELSDAKARIDTLNTKREEQDGREKALEAVQTQKRKSMEAKILQQTQMIDAQRTELANQNSYTDQATQESGVIKKKLEQSEIEVKNLEMQVSQWKEKGSAAEGHAQRARDQCNALNSQFEEYRKQQQLCAATYAKAIIDLRAEIDVLTRKAAEGAAEAAEERKQLEEKEALRRQERETNDQQAKQIDDMRTQIDRWMQEATENSAIMANLTKQKRDDDENLAKERCSSTRLQAQLKGLIEKNEKLELDSIRSKNNKNSNQEDPNMGESGRAIGDTSVSEVDRSRDSESNEDTRQAEATALPGSSVNVDDFRKENVLASHDDSDLSTAPSEESNEVQESQVNASPSAEQSSTRTRHFSPDLGRTAAYDRIKKHWAEDFEEQLRHDHIMLPKEITASFLSNLVKLAKDFTLGQFIRGVESLKKSRVKGGWRIERTDEERTGEDFVLRSGVVDEIWGKLSSARSAQASKEAYRAWVTVPHVGRPVTAYARPRGSKSRPGK